MDWWGPNAHIVKQRYFRQGISARDAEQMNKGLI